MKEGIKDLASRTMALGARAFLLLIRVLPYPAALALFRGLAVIAWMVDAFHRTVALTQIRSALPAENAALLTIKVFMNQADILVDTIRYAYLSDDEIRARVRVDGREHLDKALASGRGIMMLTGHVGNWEILLHLPRILGIGFCVMADRRNDPRLEAIVNEIRALTGATILPPTGKALMLIRELRKGRTIGIVADGRAGPKDAVYCDVFGMPAPTNPAPAFIAIKGNALVLPVCAHKIGGTYRIRFAEPFDAAAGGAGDEAVRDLSARMQSWVESMVGEQPHQWFWLYSRWVNRSDMREIIRQRKGLREFLMNRP
jgi:KDO2-lipid IV(A) lauroyltransferase